MALSEHEQRLLDEMERHLYQHEADVVSTDEREAPKLSTRSLVIALLAVAAGVAVMLAAVAFQLPVLGVLGFALMVVAVAAALSGRSPKAAAPRGDGRSRPSPAEPGAAGAPSRSSFMDKLDERWDRRQQGG